ncbi:TIGR01777 family oxidoreductase [Gordonia sp. PP30]|uniref:TIGR01777 family oxidoreductase n=1 Tax=Gordonia sp. PP30 TaxID=2935861 RepID=UPI001FFFC38A|nr:TIGR01777 family oxidoreductase [Gordonia sp. PP30]UQE73650.1 TIGR01777 family oxidoreductase [Gordonia sp. PP30]
MRIAVAGSHGLIGSALVDALTRSGHDVVRLVRTPVTGADQVRWDPETFGVPPGALNGADAVIGLGGVGLGTRRWSGWVKQRLRDSRITPTSVLAEAVADAGVPVFVSASATGFYGDTGEDAATEDSPPGDGFLADLAVDWEAATLAAAGARIVALRTAPVLAPSGGLLGRLRPLYRLGAGGSIGDGRQFFSWISLHDEVAAIEFLLEQRHIAGPVNLASPQAVRYGDFSALLAQQVHRPDWFRVPAALAHAVGGELVDELILTSSRVEPKVLTDHGFVFAHPTLPQALEYARA